MTNAESIICRYSIRWTIFEDIPAYWKLWRTAYWCIGWEKSVILVRWSQIEVLLYFVLKFITDT